MRSHDLLFKHAVKESLNRTTCSWGAGVLGALGLLGVLVVPVPLYCRSSADEMNFGSRSSKGTMKDALILIPVTGIGTDTGLSRFLHADTTTRIPVVYVCT